MHRLIGREGPNSRRYVSNYGYTLTRLDAFLVGPLLSYRQMGFKLADCDDHNYRSNVHAILSRAFEVLLENLSESQRRQFVKKKEFKVVGGQTGNNYIVTMVPYAGVKVYRRAKNSKSTYFSHRLCCTSAATVPTFENMLTQKIWLESPEHEPKFLQAAAKYGRNQNFTKRYFT